MAKLHFYQSQLRLFERLQLLHMLHQAVGRCKIVNKLRNTIRNIFPLRTFDSWYEILQSLHKFFGCDPSTFHKYKFFIRKTAFRQFLAESKPLENEYRRKNISCCTHAAYAFSVCAAVTSNSCSTWCSPHTAKIFRGSCTVDKAVS